MRTQATEPVARYYKGTPEEARSLAEQFVIEQDYGFSPSRDVLRGCGRWSEDAVDFLREELEKRYGPHFPDALKAAIRGRLG